MSGFWLSPSCKKYPCHHHWQEAEKHVGQCFSRSEATEALLRKGWVRCVTSDTDLFFERLAAPTEKQMAELKSCAMELGLRCCDDRGAVMVA